MKLNENIIEVSRSSDMGPRDVLPGRSTFPLGVIQNPLNPGV